jgi:hypothetical protein
VSDWQTRKRPTIKLTSPSGIIFIGKWKDGKETVELRVDQHGFPMVQGTRTIPMGADGKAYPLTIFFEGPNNDKDSRKFLDTLAGEITQGPWTIVHPVDGQLRLQPVGTVERDISPTSSGNISSVTTSWMVPLEDSVVSIPNTAADIEAAAAAVSQGATSTMLTAKQATAGQTASIVSAVRSKIAAIKRSIGAINSRINGIQNQINDVITQTTINMSELAGGLIALVQAPDLVKGSLLVRTRTLQKLGLAFLATLTSKDVLDAAGRNAAIVAEVVTTAITAAIAETIITDTPETRAEALALLAYYRSLDDALTAAIDAQSAASSGNNLEDQYFGGRETAQARAALRALMIRYLLGIVGDLMLERRFSLDRNWGTMPLSIKVYKSTPANADANYLKLCRTNSLHGRELLLLRAGREVVVYE